MSLEGSVVSERSVTAIAIRHQMTVQYQYKVRGEAGEGYSISRIYMTSRWAKTLDRGNLVTVSLTNRR